MKLRLYLEQKLSRTRMGNHLVRDRRYRTVVLAAISLSIDLVYAVYHGVLGFSKHSWWFVAMFGYYMVLGATRFAAVLCEGRQRTAADLELECFVRRIIGGLLVLLSCVLCGVLYVTMAEGVVKRHGQITMIAIAAYTFTRLTVTIVQAVKGRCEKSPLLESIRSIGYTTVAVSVLTMQRSMLVTFEGMSEREIVLMNTMTGAGVCAFVCMIGVLLLRKKEYHEGN